MKETASFLRECKECFNSLTIHDENYKEYQKLKNLKNSRFLQNILRFMMILHIIILISNSLYYYNQNIKLFTYFIISDGSIILIFFIMILAMYKFQLKTLKYWDIWISIISLFIVVIVMEFQLIPLISENLTSSSLVVLVSIISYIIFFKLLITNLAIKMLGLVFEFAYILMKIDATYYSVYPRLIEISGGFIFLFICQEKHDKNSFISHFSKLEEEQFWKYILNVIPNNIMIFSNRKSLLYCNDTLKKFLKKDDCNNSGVDILKWQNLKIRPESLITIKELIRMMEGTINKPHIIENKKSSLFLRMTSNFRSLKSIQTENTNQNKNCYRQKSKERVILLFDL